MPKRFPAGNMFGEHASINFPRGRCFKVALAESASVSCAHHELDLTCRAQFPKRNGCGCGNVEGIHLVRHGNQHGVVARLDRRIQQTVAFGSQNNGKFFGSSKTRVAQTYRILAKRHGNCDETGLPQTRHKRRRPIMRATWSSRRHGARSGTRNGRRPRRARTSP